MAGRPLRRGDTVQVLSPAEIYATLDDRGMLEGLPFMPEMLAFCGRRFVVNRRASKICDTMYTSRSRHMSETVLLEDLRCDGSGHGGCQAECRLFWKEAWLRRVGSNDRSRAPTVGDQAAADALANVVTGNASRQTSADQQPMRLQYVCQATEHFRASVPLRTWDPRPYVREYTSGNVGLWRFLSVVARALVQEPLRRLRFRGAFPLRGPHTEPPLRTPLGLRLGELVRVKTRDQIATTLTRDGVNHGVWFDDENLPYCGGTYRVRARITRLIDEHSGQLKELRNDWVALENVVCSGEHSLGRWFCPRAFPVQWTEEWLERVEGQPAATVANVSLPGDSARE